MSKDKSQGTAILRSGKGASVRALLCCVLITIASALILSMSINPWISQAQAITVEKTTARANQPGGKGVVGGEPTRITWEAKLSSDEEVEKITLVFPEGSDLSQVSVSDAVLQGLKRSDPQREPEKIEGNSIELVYTSPLAPESLLRVQIEGVSLPVQGGQLQIAGSYLSQGTSHDLPLSPAIEVITSSRLDRAISWLDRQSWVQRWNSVQFLDMFFRPQLIVSSLAQLFPGWLKALALVALGFPLAIPLGLIFSFLKMGASKIGRFFASLYINVIRGTPLFLQIYIAFFGLPLLGINVDNYILGVVVLALNSSAYLAEIFRAGIQSINKGQFEAAASLGMNSAQTMFYVIIPQTFRRVIPTMTSEFILLYKDTSLLSSVGLLELMMFSKNLTASTGNITPYVVAAGYYLLVTMPLIKLVTYLEHRLEDGAGSSKVQDAKDQSVRPEIKAAIHGSM